MLKWFKQTTLVCCYNNLIMTGRRTTFPFADEAHICLLSTSIQVDGED